MTDHLATLIKLALEEDVGSGDITTAATVDPDLRGSAVLRAKSPLVVAGLQPAREVFSAVDDDLVWISHIHEGDRVDAGTTLATISGRLASILTAERVALNFLQKLSGIATLTRRFVDAVRGTEVQILDTRKTTPGWRTLEKKAVTAGGGLNHRLGLFDRYLIKNNHIAAAGGLRPALHLVKKIKHPDLQIEVEAHSVQDAIIAAREGVDIIILDNFSVEDVREAVKLVKSGGAPCLEVSRSGRER